MSANILKENVNCWKKVQVNRLSLLFDSCEYFDAFFEVAPKAKKSLALIGWEVEGDVGLENASPKYPNDLRDYFRGLIQKSPGLQILVSAWRPALWLKFGRELFATPRWWVRTRGKVSYRQKRAHFMFGSRHEKLVVLDGKLAFLGGIDITKDRWDSHDHELSNEKRLDSEGHDWCPTHDLQVVVSGDIISTLEEFARTRTPELASSSVKGASLWPDSARPGIENVNAGLARTDAEKKIFEIETFYLDAVSNAQNYIYIENQYFTHEKIAEAIERKLSQADGPEVVIVLPLHYPGFFENLVYSRGRKRQINRLIKADIHKRLRVLYPARPGEGRKNFIVVHSKFMAVDDTLLTMGSANLNNRSMRADGELNLILEEEGDQRVARFIRSSVSQLLSEHLDVSESEFSHCWNKKRSLIGAINSFQNMKRRGLRRLPLDPYTWPERLFGFLSPFVDLKYQVRTALYDKVIAFIALFLLIAAGYAYEA